MIRNRHGDFEIAKLFGWPLHTHPQSQSTMKEGIIMSKNNAGVAVVTGASSGIGQATAKALQQAGYRVFGTSQRTGFSAKDGIEMLTCDVTDDRSVTLMVNDVLDRAGRIDLLVNNAGVGLVGGGEESSIAQAQLLFNVNFFGVMRVTNAVLPVMRRQKKGRIINMSSLLGLIPSPYNSIYSASKHALEGYSESLDHELRTLGIRVALVEPGYTNTAFEKSKTKPDQPLSIYDSVRAQTERLMQKSVEQGDAPEVVAATALKAADDKVPSRRYPAGKLARQVRMLRRFVPESAFDKNLRKQANLPV